MARCILIESSLPYEYWPFAVRYAIYTMNRLPTKSIGWKTPYELWMKRKPEVDHMRPFGCIAYAQIDKILRTSIEPTSTKCTLLGYAQYQKGYVLEQQHDKKIVVRRGDYFDEQSLNRQTTTQIALEDDDPLAINTDMFETNLHYSISEFPKSYREAQTLSDAKEWHEAAVREMESHRENQTWTLIEPPQNVKPIQGRWGFTKKTDAKGIETYKARFVAKGYSQVLWNRLSRDVCVCTSSAIATAPYQHSGQQSMEYLSTWFQDGLPECTSSNANIPPTAWGLHWAGERKQGVLTQQSSLWAKAGWSSVATRTVHADQTQRISAVTKRAMHMVQEHRSQDDYNRHLGGRYDTIRRRRKSIQDNLDRHGRKIPNERLRAVTRISRDPSD